MDQEKPTITFTRIWPDIRLAKSLTPSDTSGIKKLRTSIKTKKGIINSGTPEGRKTEKKLMPCKLNPIITLLKKITKDSDIVKIN